MIEGASAEGLGESSLKMGRSCVVLKGWSEETYRRNISYGFKKTLLISEKVTRLKSV